MSRAVERRSLTDRPAPGRSRKARPPLRLPQLGSPRAWLRRLADVRLSRWLRRLQETTAALIRSLRMPLRASDWAVAARQTWRRAARSPRAVIAVAVLLAVLAIAGFAAYVARAPRMSARIATPPTPTAPPAPADRKPAAAPAEKIADSLLRQGWTSLAEAYQLYAVHLAPDGALLSDEGPIELYGIKVPIRSQVCAYQSGERWACGQRAYIALLNFVGRTTLACRVRHSDQPGVFICKLAGIDIGKWMLSSGWATLADGVTDKRYIAAANEGIKRKLGMWAAAP